MAAAKKQKSPESYAMNRNGFYFSLEAALTLALIALILISPKQKMESDASTILLQQKMHDFLLVSAKQRSFSMQELKSNFEFVFPDKNGKIEIGSEIIEIETKHYSGNSKIVETINFVD